MFDAIFVLKLIFFCFIFSIEFHKLTSNRYYNLFEELEGNFNLQEIQLVLWCIKKALLNENVHPIFLVFIKVHLITKFCVFSIWLILLEKSIFGLQSMVMKILTFVVLRNIECWPIEMKHIPCIRPGTEVESTGNWRFVPAARRDMISEKLEWISSDILREDFVVSP